MNCPLEFLDQAQEDSCVRKAGDEPLPGYRLLEPLGKGGFGEVWKCEVPGGLYKAIKFINGNLNTLDQGSTQAVQELDALQHIKLIRHPFVLSTERIEIQGGEVLIVMELADKNLEEVFLECKSAGLAGIPRETLLIHLLEVAEVLDLMSQQHGLQHLDIKPRNVLLVSNHVKLADFGLVKQVDQAHARNKAARIADVSPQYASPEAFHGNYSRHSDQYSLAILYQQMLTGALPFQGKNARQIMVQHVTAKPDLDYLPAADRPVVARALAKDPAQRYPSCRAFVRELAYGTDEPSKLAVARASVSAGTPRPLGLSSLRNLLNGTKPSTDAAGQAAKAVRADEAVFAPMPKFQFLDCLSQRSLGELWKAQEPNGRVRLIHFLPGTVTSEDNGWQLKVRRLRECRHLMVPPLEIYQNTAGQLVFVTDCYTRTLRDRYHECSAAQGLPGIPRHELLRYLAAAAEALDDLFWRYEITHLGLSPQTLAFHKDRMVMNQFGYLELARLLAGQSAAPPNLRYAAPELARTVGSSASDQFSLALIYAEMLTGLHPRPDTLQARRRRAGGDKLDLDLVPAADRDVLMRALDSDPDRRFASCAEFVQALKRSTVAVRDTGRLPGRLLPVIPFASLLGESLSPSADLPSVDQLITQQQNAQTGAAVSLSCGNFHYTVAPNGTLEHTFSIRSLERIGSLKLDGFRQHGKTQLVSETDYTLRYRLNAHQSLWDHWLGNPQGIEIVLSMPPVTAEPPDFTQVTIRIEAFGGDLGTHMLRQSGLELIMNLRRFLQPTPERRLHSRLAYRQPLRIYAILPDLELAEPIAGIGKDLSHEGICLRVPQRPAAAYFYVHLNTSEPLGRWALLAKVLRVEATDDGWFEVGAVFPPALETS